MINPSFVTWIVLPIGKIKSFGPWPFCPEELPNVLPWVHTAISNAKRQLLGVYYKIKPEYLQYYLNRFCYKFNRRYFGKKQFERLLITAVWIIRSIPTHFSETFFKFIGQMQIYPHRLSSLHACIKCLKTGDEDIWSLGFIGYWNSCRGEDCRNCRKV